MEGTCALILAAGRGERFGRAGGKLWSLVGGVPVLRWAVSAFQEHPEVDRIVLVGREQDLPRLREQAASFDKVIAVVRGGRERWGSVQLGARGGSR